ncbi:MAG: hypothetical protein COV55_01840 [Candidatus Komeilibacteria bacterium CG11_big_fil_rev_8_21_14_0_20_36_20]|uniref:Tautomerase enzyme n=1 Tax=Candidatus Komeilibacteria bacterium CG11_big_fil_rev_8_21_14_0_20_36_20 TaxID=1974477 RepID=A0A2H0NE26_9BACT|nr:MAG: hypothetical protein COV55_01840 [Candidatus Komeilibacteria bacterium CG11_big_fil_rev_8_21_14_0_20_36_20]PIR81285.1 MAG: hypothetical protein COU21_04825 [Candidatus Komeilibacteria bacterium CG10_big_fil_rev_8_21_14_0_10_36_65]PJC55249.1 MAG: hypothetical protein CO027_03765 [Candidatus Komeilibacteria bacterium CG_4_9_14_0_2_um_filter_36_13]
MPLIVIYNLTQDELKDEDKISAIEKAITKKILYVSELGLTEDDIGYSFPQDPTVTSNDIPVYIIMELLFDKPERTNAVRSRLAVNIREAFWETVKAWRTPKKIAVAVKRFNPEADGFAYR